MLLLGIIKLLIKEEVIFTKKQRCNLLYAFVNHAEYDKHTNVINYLHFGFVGIYIIIHHRVGVVWNNRKKSKARL